MREEPGVPAQHDIEPSNTPHARLWKVRGSFRSLLRSAFCFLFGLLCAASIILKFNFLQSMKHDIFRGSTDTTESAYQGEILPFHRQLESETGLDVSVAIRAHILRARKVQEDMLARQSRTDDQARSYYQQQHSGESPSEFLSAWTDFALAHNSSLVEDFGQAEASFTIFRQVSPQNLRERVANLMSAKDLYWRGRIVIRSGMIYVEDGPKNVLNAVRGILAPLNGSTPLPDMVLPTCWDDLPRASAALSDAARNDIHSSWTAKKDRFDAARKGCPSTSRITQSKQSKDRPSVDVCEADNELPTQHGYFHEGHGQIDTLVPIASFTRISTATDVIVPHPCFADGNFRTWDLPDDTFSPFEERLSSIYWRGSSTGSIARTATWRQAHRPRFVGLIQAMRHYSSKYELGMRDIDTGGLDDILSGQGKTLTLNALQRLPSTMFNVSFTQMANCQIEPNACEEMQKAMPTVKHSPWSSAFQHKYLFDLDGNSQSCRFYRLLETDSLVFKQTIWNEWHDDRIIPWLHYIPVSTSYRELPVLLDYFNNHPDGRHFAKQIAREGMQLARSSLRSVDLTIYWYRILVEYAHVLYPLGSSM